MSLPETDVLILCGGLGIRLRPSVGNCPKVMVPINGKPFLAILLEKVAAHGFKRFVLCTGYGNDLVREHFRAECRFSVEFSEESRPLGTAGALRNAKSLLRSARLVVMNGDSILPLLDYRSLLGFHEAKGGLATVAVTALQGRQDGGCLLLGDDHRVVSFHEKKYEASGCLNAGVYVFEAAVLEKIPQDRSFSLEKELLPSLEEAGLWAFETSSPCFDIGTPKRLEEFKDVWMRESALRS